MAAERPRPVAITAVTRNADVIFDMLSTGFVDVRCAGHALRTVYGDCRQQDLYSMHFKVTSCHRLYETVSVAVQMRRQLVKGAAPLGCPSKYLNNQRLFTSEREKVCLCRSDRVYAFRHLCGISTKSGGTTTTG